MSKQTMYLLGMWRERMKMSVVWKRGPDVFGLYETKVKGKGTEGLIG